MAEETQDTKVEPDGNPNAVRFTETMDEAKAKVAEAKAPQQSAAELGVDQASFDKYYKDGNFDWASYGKEQAFKARQQATKPVEEPKPSQTPRTSNAPKHSETSEAQSVVQKAGLDWDALGDKIMDTGTIGDEDFKALESIGIPQNVVQDYIKAVHDQAQNLIDEVIEEAGGQEVFDRVFDALADKPTELKEKIDDLLADKSTRQYGIDMAFKEAGIERPTGSPAQTEAQPATTPSSYAGEGRAASSDARAFGSFQEQVDAMRDPRYKTDTAYRNEVLARIAASDYDIGTGRHTGGL
jgi:hypothetical protein